MSFQTGREGKGVRSSADRRFKDKSAAYTVWKYFSWLILTALWLTEDVLMKGHCVFRRNHYFIKAGINSLQSESNQNIKNKVMAKAEQFLIVFLPLVGLGFGCHPPVCCCKHPAFFQTNHFQIWKFSRKRNKMQNIMYSCIQDFCFFHLGA